MRSKIEELLVSLDLALTRIAWEVHQCRRWPAGCTAAARRAVQRNRTAAKICLKIAHGTSIPDGLIIYL